jgi:hypothetical protein
VCSSGMVLLLAVLHSGDSMCWMHLVYYLRYLYAICRSLGAKVPPSCPVRFVVVGGGDRGHVRCVVTHHVLAGGLVFWVVRANTQWAGVGAVRMQPGSRQLCIIATAMWMVSSCEVTSANARKLMPQSAFLLSRTPLAQFGQGFPPNFSVLEKLARTGSYCRPYSATPFSRAACSDDSQLADMSIHFW